MNVTSFYGSKTRRISCHIISNSVPDDGNVSDVGNVADDDSNDGDTLYRLADSDSSPQSSESDTADSDSSKDDDQMHDDWADKYHSYGQQPTFAQDSGPLIVLPPEASATNFFNLMFPDSLWCSLVAETNRHALSKPSQQEETNETEMKAFIGVTLAMAIYKLPQIKNYWSGHWVLGVPQYRQIFPHNRYWYLFSNIHLVDNAECLPRDDLLHDRLFNVRPLISKLNETFAKHYSPSRNISVDESMVRFKGRSMLKQYLPMKPIKWGFKVWCLSCSYCVYLLKFQVYAGQDTEQNFGLAHRVVTDLLCPLYTKCNYVVYRDNFFYITAIVPWTETEWHFCMWNLTYKPHGISPSAVQCCWAETDETRWCTIPSQKWHNSSHLDRQETSSCGKQCSSTNNDNSQEKKSWRIDQHC